MKDKVSESVPFIKLPTSDDHEDGADLLYQAQRPQPRRGWQMLALAAAFVLGLLTTASCAAVWRAAAHHGKPNRALPFIREGSDPQTGLPASWHDGDCGSTPDDAAARGCRFDIVLHSWLPPDCITAEDDADAVLMYAGRDWAWRLGNGTEVSLDLVRTGQFDHVATSFDWHVTHCMFVWKRMHRAMLDADRRLDSYTANYHHTSHCAEMIGGGGDEASMKDSGSKIFAKYPICA